MATSDEERTIRQGPRVEGKGRIVVEDAHGRRPYMRGIMIHSLMARGVPFDDAYHAANQIRERFRDRPVIQKEELAKAVLELVGPGPFQDDGALPVTPAIAVTDDRGAIPFSKGHLSQSLLAAALDPNDAYEVAREIERELLALGAREIPRHELRRVAFETLSREKGHRAAERYLVWRKYQDPERPVIILLGGTAGVGKTSLALEVAHRLAIGRVLSTDSIRQIMRIMLSPDLVPAIHGSSYDARKLVPSAGLTGDAVLEGFRAQAETVSVGIRASMDRAISENASLLIDGTALLPGMMDFDAYAELADVIFLVVSTLDTATFANRFAARAAGERRRAQHRYLENLDAIVKIQDHLLELADRFDVPIVDNDSFERSVLFIIRHVTDTLRKRGDFDADELL